MTLAFGIAILVAAIAAKAWEPLAATLSRSESGGVPFAAVLVLCEACKVLACAPLLARHGLLLGLPLQRSLFAFGGPAALLALSNLLFGYAVVRVGPVTYTVVHMAVSIIVTAVLARWLLKTCLAPTQWAAVGLLLLGASMCVATPEEPHAGVIAPTSAVEWRLGLLGTFVAALSLALHLVWFEGASGALPGTALQHLSSFAVWGLVANAAVLVTLEWRWLASWPFALQWAGVRTADLLAALTIAATDLTAVHVAAVHGSNAYSFARVVALLISSALAVLVLGVELGAGVCCGATLVGASTWLYKWAGGGRGRGGGGGSGGSVAPSTPTTRLAAAPTLKASLSPPPTLPNTPVPTRQSYKYLKVPTTDEASVIELCVVGIKARSPKGPEKTGELRFSDLEPRHAEKISVPGT